MSDISRMTIDIPKEFKNAIKARSALLGQNMKEYVVESIKNRMYSDESLEDQHLVKLAEEAEKEGFISEEASKDLLERMRNA